MTTCRAYRPLIATEKASRRKAIRILAAAGIAVKAVAAFVQYSVATVRRWIRRGAETNDLNDRISDPEFFPKMEHLISLYKNPPRNLFFFDESPGIQILMRLSPDLRTEETKKRLEEFEYIRNGTMDVFACRETGRYEEGIAALKKSLQLAPNEVLGRVILVSLYMYAGREDEARATVAEIQRIDPNFSVDKFTKALPYKNEATRDRYIDSLRKAGLK
jgi:hypothetical protein